MELSRRELLVSILQALLLSLFPWLRGSERGHLVAKAGAEELVGRAIYKAGTFKLSVSIKGYDFSDSPEIFAQLKNNGTLDEVARSLGIEVVETNGRPNPEMFPVEELA